MSYGSTATFHASDEVGVPASPRSLLLYGPETSMRVVLPALGDVVLGRGDDCTVVLDDRAASRKHARIVCEVGNLVVEDLASHNGTILNGKRLEHKAPLSAGDLINIGETCIVVYAATRGPEYKVLDPMTFTRRVEEHAERSRREAYLALVCVITAVESGVETDVLQSAPWRSLLSIMEPREELGMLDDGACAIVAPIEEQGIESRLEAWLKALGNHREGVAVGVAIASQDGANAPTLLAAARAAAETAAPGAWAYARDAFAERRLDQNTTVLLADPSMLRAYALIDRLARGTMPVLVRGETGSGKELAALALHRASPRADGPYCTVNCAAVAETLLESELFGHERGAFTGATTQRIGFFESANGGTLFLDEVGELTPSAQAKLLRVLETGKITRVGSSRETTVDVRVVAATHRDLVAESETGGFRKDLYFRIGAATVLLPPLRERPREIPLLARAFLARVCERMKRKPIEISPLALQALLIHAWPGNARELRNVIEYAAALAEGSRVEPWHLPPLADAHLLPTHETEPRTVPNPKDGAPPATKPSPLGGHMLTLAEEIRDLERMRIVEALKSEQGVQTKVAARLGMPVRTLFAKLRAHAIDPKEFATKRSAP